MQDVGEVFLIPSPSLSFYIELQRIKRVQTKEGGVSINTGIQCQRPTTTSYTICICTINTNCAHLNSEEELMQLN